MAGLDNDPDQQKGYGMMVRAEAEEMDPEIFVYHRMRPTDPYHGDLFEAVASINQYEEVPAYEPKVVSDDEIIPYYRRNQMEVYARTPSELEEIWAYLQVDVGQLVRDYNATEILIEHKVADINPTGGSVETVTNDNSYILQLAWEPAGEWTGASITPDVTQRGWLPISEFNSVFPGKAHPDGAVWFYNMPAESLNVQDLYSALQNPAQSVLDLNGVPLLYGPEGAYMLSEETVFWMPNDNYQIEMVSQNPWPDDYVPGVTDSERVLRLLVPAV